MKYLVTGGAGFVGSHFARRQLERGHQVTNLDAMAHAGVRATVDELDEYDGHRFVLGDVADHRIVDGLVAGHDVVVHFAAESHVDRSFANSAGFIRTNVMGTGVLVGAAHRHRIPRFVHVSSDEVYGSIAVGAASEADPLVPSSPYSASKASSDLVVLAYAATYGYDVIVSRGSNTYGSYQFPEKMIPLFTTNLLRGLRVPLYGDGLHERDWLHVDDHCAAIDRLITEGASGEVYNVGTGELRSNGAVAAQLADLTGADRDLIQHVADRPGHDRRYSIDTTKVRSLGWSPRRSFDEAIVETVEWYAARRDWWGPLVSRS